eukprot:403373629
MRQFPRAAAKPKTTSITQRLDEAQKQKQEYLEQMEYDEEQQAVEEHLRQDGAYGLGEERINDKRHKEYHSVSQLTFGAERVPEDMQKRMKKVFSKHLVGDVREWSKMLMKNYQLLHAIEKPMNLDYVKPFANTSDLLNKTPHIHANEAKQRKEMERQKQEEEQKQKTGEDASAQTLEMEQDEASDAFKAKENKKTHSEVVEEAEHQLFTLNYKREHTIGYLQRKMPYNYYIYRRLLNEVKERLPNFKPEAGLDYGAGLGSGVWAMQHIYGKQNAVDNDGSLIRSAAVEPNVNMRKLGKYLSEDLNEKAENGILWVDSLSMIPGSGGEKGKFDIIVIGFVLQEVASAKQRQLIIEALWSRLKDNGVFILTEPGSPKGYRYINSFRDWVIAKDRTEASIIAPCPNHHKCPLASNPDQWCHFSQMVQRLQSDTFPKLPREKQMVNEKYSYLIVRKGTVPSTIKDGDVTEDDFKTPHEKSYFWPRLIRPIMKKHKHSIADMCNSSGQVERRIIAKSHGMEGGYSKSKKLKWGDLWYFEKRIPHKFRKEGKYGKRLW